MPPRKKPETKAATKAKSKGKIAPVVPIENNGFKNSLGQFTEGHSYGFKAGASGNPGGRPRGLADVKKLAREHSLEAIGTLADVMQDKGATASARVAAAEALLDRGFGKSVQQHEHGGPGAFDAMADEELDAFILDKASKFVDGFNTLN